jgi:hypothetical protein
MESIRLELERFEWRGIEREREFSDRIRDLGGVPGQRAPAHLSRAGNGSSDAEDSLHPAAPALAAPAPVGAEEEATEAVTEVAGPEVGSDPGLRPPCGLQCIGAAAAAATMTTAAAARAATAATQHGGARAGLAIEDRCPGPATGAGYDDMGPAGGGPGPDQAGPGSGAGASSIAACTAGADGPQLPPPRPRAGNPVERLTVRLLDTYQGINDRYSANPQKSCNGGFDDEKGDGGSGVDVSGPISAAVSGRGTAPAASAHCSESGPSCAGPRSESAASSRAEAAAAGSGPAATTTAPAIPPPAMADRADSGPAGATPPPEAPRPFAGEVGAAAKWWATRMRQDGLSPEGVAAFEQALRAGMEARCDGHWYPLEPWRGSAHRSVVNDQTIDPLLAAAAAAAGIRDAAARLPRAVLWINPGGWRVKVERDPPAVLSVVDRQALGSQAEAGGGGRQPTKSGGGGACGGAQEGRCCAGFQGGPGQAGRGGAPGEGTAGMPGQQCPGGHAGQGEEATAARGQGKAEAGVQMTGQAAGWQHAAGNMQAPGGGDAAAAPAAAAAPLALPPSSMSKDQLMRMLVNAPRAQATQILGERLYALIHPSQGPLAGKITGMLLQGLDSSELVVLVDDHGALQSKIREALAALEAHFGPAYLARAY